MKRMWSQCSTWVVRLRFVQTEREGQAFLKKERMTDPFELINFQTAIGIKTI